MNFKFINFYMPMLDFNMQYTLNYYLEGQQKFRKVIEAGVLWYTKKVFLKMRIRHTLY